jgi:hypothetical protein
MGIAWLPPGTTHYHWEVEAGERLFEIQIIPLIPDSTTQDFYMFF